jgi:FkbM family methyltransferase
LRENFWKRFWPGRGRDAWTDILGYVDGKIDTIIDVGANIGQSTSLFADRFPGAKIYCFEPFKNPFESLTTRFNSAADIACFNFGLGDRPQTIELYLDIESGWNSIPANRDCGLGSETIEIKRLDDFCADRNIDRINLLKTDTEGYDLHVLRGAERQLANGLIDCIYTEVGFNKDDASHTSFCGVLDYLSNMGYQLFCFYDQDWLCFLPHPHEPRYPWSNAIFLRNGIVVDKEASIHQRFLDEIGLDAGLAAYKKNIEAVRAAGESPKQA